MQFLITQIELDFEGEDLHPEEEHDIINDIVGRVWEADNEEDLAEEITAASGWLVKSLDYRFVLK